MLLTVKNVAKIRHADIQLDGITVIAGKNNTGKSTIGKSLYCMFNSFYNSSEKMIEERNNYSENLIRQYLRQFDLSPPTQSKIRSDIVRELAALEVNSESLEDEILNILQKHINKHEKRILNFSENAKRFGYIDLNIENVANSLFEVLSVDLDFFQKTLIDKYFYEEFRSQINHVDHDNETAEVELKIKKKPIKVAFKQNRCFSFSQNIPITVEALYCDSPFILDSIERNLSFLMREELGHQIVLINKLKTGRSKTTIEEAMRNKKLESVIQKINTVASGDFIKNDEEREESFKETGFSKPLHFSNLSAGLKTFVLLKWLINAGHFEDKGVLILDEPEVHLHPEWQLLFAEILVMLQKEYNLSVLLTTHSPYFLRAIQAYSHKYEIESKCNYYLAELKDNYATFTNVNGSTESIYKLLAAPLQQLEDTRWEEL